jgi:hypothetical protein
MTSSLPTNPETVFIYGMPNVAGIFTRSIALW